MVSTLQKHTVTAFYEHRDHAESAANKLRQSGVPANDVTVSPDSLGVDDGRDGTGATARKGGFWASLEELFGGTDDHDTYAEGLRRGHVMLTAHIDDAHLDRAVAILDEHGTIDLDEHEAAWRSEGWAGPSTTASTSTASTATTSTAMASTATAGGAMDMALAATAAPARLVATDSVATPVPAARAPVPAPAKPAIAGNASGRGAEDVVQVVEERLNVGKRAVSRGKVRLHSYVVEREVSENVTLRDETVSIDRHAVDRPVATLAADAFAERTIEMEEIGEEAVVAKTARVVEEIGIRKDVTDRTETVHDSVRSTKVDIEDGRTVGTGSAGLGGPLAARIAKDLEVVGSDGGHVGIVDRVDGAMLKLKRLDTAADGQHHLLPMDLVKTVDGKVVLGIAAGEAMRRWQAV